MSESSTWSIRDLTVGYGSKAVLEALNLDLPTGLITSVMGPGGSGKTTLMQSLAGPPYPADMWIRGFNLPDTHTTLIVPQRSGRERDRKVFEQLKALEPGSVLFLDEPFVSLPTSDHDELHDRLKKLRFHHTILCVSHNLKHARRLSDHVVLLVEGELIESAPTDEFFNRPGHPRTSDFLATGS